MTELETLDLTPQNIQMLLHSFVPAASTVHALRTMCE